MTAFDGFSFRAFMDWSAAIFLAIGLVFMFVGALGTVRLPDAYNRMHAASKCVTLGLTGMLLAACYHIESAPIVTKAIATIVFTFVATPIGTHLLSKAAHHGGLEQWDKTLSDELEEDKKDLSRSVTDDFEALDLAETGLELGDA
jgi:multicomponent Na+:H+ antiporter subunit G